ncbi:MAG: hypothetical protein SFT93_03280 [Rickettsiaceae bacterium]|nr:hypothetical protein [Rickettsiaceae bacterium]
MTKVGSGNDSYDHSVIPVKTGIQELYIQDSRLRGNDKIECGNDKSKSRVLLASSIYLLRNC